MNDENLVIGWPLSMDVQQGLAERIQAAVKAKRSELIACYCRETGFALVCHVADGVPVLWECIGPLTEQQADTWIQGSDNDADRPRAIQ